MISFFRDLLDTSGFPARWHCGQWSAGHGWLHILADIAIFGAYAAIPLALAYFIRRRKDVPFAPIFWLFGAFIFSCGFTHLIEATIFWHPWYRLSGLMKAVTAVVSWMTVIALIKTLPSALALPGLAKINRQLSEEIAERRRAEETTARLAAIVESSQDAIVSKDLRGTITSWNRGAEVVFGFSSEEIVGHSILQLIPPERRNEETEILARVARGEVVRPFETVRLRKDGSTVEVSVTVSPIRDASGTIVGASKVARDITERTRATAALRESDERFRAAVAAVSSLIWTNDAEGMMKGDQPGWANFTGQTQAEYQGHGWTKAVHPDDAQPTLAAWGHAVTEKKLFEFEHRLRRADGEWRLCSIRAVPVVGSDGAIREWVGVHTDITEGKRDEEALRQAHHRLEIVLGSITDGLAVLDKDWRYTYVSEQAARIIGIPQERLLGGCLWDLFPAAEGTKFHEGFHRAVNTGQKVDFEEYYPEPINKWLECHCYPSVEGLSIYFCDVTARKQAEEEIRASNQRMLLATEATGVGIWEWNVLTGEIRWDVQMFRLYGITPTADGFVQYSTWTQTVLPEDLPEQEAILQDTVRRAGDSSRAFRIRRKSDGECRHIEAVETARTNPLGQTEWIIGTNLDVTERKRAEQARKQNEALFSLLIEQAPLGVYVVDAQFRLQQVNSLAEPVFSKVRPLIGRDFTEVMETCWGPEVGGEVARIFRHTLETGERYISPPFVHPRADLGVEQAYDWEAQRVTLPDGRHGVVCYFVDVTERRRAETALLEAKEAAETANQSKDRFLAALSHELRTPLTPVLLVSGLHAKSEKLSEDLREDFEMIHRNIVLEAQLIDDLLDISRIQQGKMRFDFKFVDVHEAIARSLEMLRSEVDEKGIAVRQELHATPALIEADPTRLRQVLVNLLRNAVKFTPHGGTITLLTAREPGDVQISVTDTGAGIPAEDLQRIFEAFEQVEHQQKSEYRSLGLGLAISASIVAAHRGRIWAESPGRDQGATFHVRIPC